MNLRARRVTRSGREVTLARKEFDLLALLAKRAGEASRATRSATCCGDQRCLLLSG